ncbi:MAG: tetratricopeptide repeat protein [Cyanobacteria bacterium P01_F01_bin.150]
MLYALLKRLASAPLFVVLAVSMPIASVMLDDGGAIATTHRQANTQSIDSEAQSSELTPEEKQAEGDRLFNEAVQLWRTSQWQEALERFEKALVLYREVGDRQSEGRTLNGLGIIADDFGQHIQALDYYQQALAISREIGDRAGEGATLNNIGLIYDNLGDAAQALDYYQQSLESKREIGDRAGEGITLNNIGKIYNLLGDYPQALDYYQQALEISREIGDRAGEGTILNNIGTIYNSLGDYPQSLDYYQQSLEISREIGDHAGEGVTLNNIGEIYRKFGNYSQSLDYYQQSSEISRKIGDRATLGKNLNNIGEIYYKLGDYPQSLDYYQQSLEISREIGNKATESLTLSNIGVVYRSLSNYPQSLDYYQQSLGISREIGNQKVEGAILNNIGAIYNSLGDYQQSLNYYQQSLEISREIGDRKIEGTILNNIGFIYNSLGNYQQSLDHYQQSLEISREIGDRATEGITLNNIGLIYNFLDDSRQSLDHYQQSLEISREIGDRATEGLNLNNIGFIYNSLGDYQKSLNYYQQSLEISRKIGDQATEGLTLHNIGELLDQIHQPELAIIFLKQSVSTYEKIRQTNQRLSQELRQSYTDTIADAYRKLADLLLQHDRILEAQRVLDLLKVQELDEYLQEVQRSDPDAETITNRAPEQAIQDEFDTLLNDVIAMTQRLQELEQLLTRTAAQDTELIELSKQARQLIQAFNTFWDSDSVQAQVALLRQTTDGESIDLSNYRDLQASLAALDQNAVLLYPFVLDDRLELVLVTPDADTPIRKTVPVERLELNRAIAHYRSALESKDSNYLPLAQTLHGWLLEPFADEFAELEVETIIYAPDDQLRYIPLAALHDGDQWTVEQYRVNNITAASLMDITLLPKQDPKVFAAAFTEGRHTVPVGDRSLTFDGLTYAGQEVENLAALLPTTTKRLNDAFNPDTVYLMNSYNIVHLATHASFVPENAYQSFILFGDGTPVTLPNIREWRLPDVDLVVLSACETGVGDKLGDGREILGLGYQMQKAGAKASLASLWQVSDGGTQTLMDAFYLALNNGYGKAEALQRAQQALITGDQSLLENGERGASLDIIDIRTGQPLAQSIDLSHPYYWAPFILIGNGL